MHFFSIEPTEKVKTSNFSSEYLGSYQSFQTFVTRETQKWLFFNQKIAFLQKQLILVKNTKTNFLIFGVFSVIFSLKWVVFSNFFVKLAKICVLRVPRGYFNVFRVGGHPKFQVGGTSGGGNSIFTE